jgi:nucleotide-binding universal stress UspA family protein
VCKRLTAVAAVIAHRPASERSHDLVSTLFIPSPAASRGQLPDNWPDRVVVATDGRSQSDAALRAGRALCGSVAFEVLTVIEPADASADDQPVPAPPSIDAQRALVEAQLRRVLDESRASISVRSGFPPAVLASFAMTHGTSLLVVGLGQPRVFDRLLGGESLYRLARMARTPLFAVANDVSTPPRRLVVATDFTAPSTHAAMLALSVAAFDAEVVLAHVMAPDARPSHGRLRRLAESLQTGFCGRVKPVLLEGDPATELLSLATDRGADAIAFATHSHATSGNTSLGSVASRLVRCAGCSVLLMPA